MTPDAKGVLRKYQSEDAGIGSLSPEDARHPVNGPTSYTSSSHDKNVRVRTSSVSRGFYASWLYVGCGQTASPFHFILHSCLFLSYTPELAS